MLVRRKPTKTFDGLGRVEELAGVAIVPIILVSAVVARYEAIDRLHRGADCRRLSHAHRRSTSLAVVAGRDVLASGRIQAPSRRSCCAEAAGRRQRGGTTKFRSAPRHGGDTTTNGERSAVRADYLTHCSVLKILERAKGFEPSTLTLARLCSTPELHPHSMRHSGRQSLGSRRSAAYMPNRYRLCNPNSRRRPLPLASARAGVRKG